MTPTEPSITVLCVYVTLQCYIDLVNGRPEQP